MNRSSLRYLSVAGALAVLLTGPAISAESTDQALARLANTSKAFTAVARKAIPAVVFITAERSVRVVESPQQFYFNDPFDLFNDDFFNRFFRHRMPRRQPAPGQQPQQKPKEYRQQLGQGSGFIISKDGIILTNNHVVGEADRITVKLKDGREFEAKKIGTDPKSDVAVIKIDGSNFPFLPLGDSDKLEVGEWVMAIGNPFGLAETVTVGVVSAKGRSRVGITDYEDFIQTDAAINPGNSGGPLLNLKGEAIGINTAIFSKSGGYMGIGFAIPMNMATKIKDQLVKTGKVTRGYLGIFMQNLTPELAESLGVKEAKGILVAEVVDGSPAAKAGLKQGDIIARLDGKPVEDTGRFRNTIGLKSPGTKAKLTVIRDGKEIQLTVTIGTWSENGMAASSPGSSTEVLEKLGFQVQELTGELAERFGYNMGEGVLISQVQPGSPAAYAGLRPGTLIASVNRQKVKNLSDFYKALKSTGKKKSVLLRVKNGQGVRFVVLKWE